MYSLFQLPGPGMVGDHKTPKMGFLPEVVVAYLDEKTFSSGTPNENV